MIVLYDNPFSPSPDDLVQLRDDRLQAPAVLVPVLLATLLRALRGMAVRLMPILSRTAPSAATSTR